jgi:diadenylate cyclase
MVRRISEEIHGYAVELGTDGRLLSLQLEELVGGLGPDRELVLRDYLPTGKGAKSVETAMADLVDISATELLDLAAGARAVGFAGPADTLDTSVSPRGYRLLTRIPRLPGAIIERLVEHFDSLQRLLAANIEDLMAVEGVGESRARAVREGLSRMAESSILERYV